MSLKQSLTQRLDMRLSPQQIQLMKLLQIPTVELNQRIKDEIENNPALEESFPKDEELDSSTQDYESVDNENKNESSDRDDFDISAYFDQDTPDYKSQMNYSQQTQEERSIPIVEENSFRERLIDQLSLSNLDDTQRTIADFIVGSLDDSGYLNREVSSIVDDLAFSINLITDESEVEHVLESIQNLDPAGIGARNLRECLMLQLERKLDDDDSTKLIAYTILDRYFDDFSKKHYSLIQTQLELSETDLKEIIEEIMKLNPKPGGASGSSKDASQNIIHITPDFTILEFEGRLELTVHGKNAPELRINRGYENILKRYAENAKITKSERETVRFVQQKMESARWFIDAIKQRQNTLFVTMKAIMDYQKDFFLTGDESLLRPMILKDISQLVGLDISTVSRVVNSKYVQTNYGIFSLRYFFSEAVSSDRGEEMSIREIKQTLIDTIANENKQKPLTDERLMEMFQEKGYSIARRTIAKYREQLNIPVARMRREL